MNRNFLLVTSLVASLGVLAGAGIALGDSASISGDACYNADDWGPFAHVSPDNEYGMHGVQTGDVDIVCPVSLDDEYVGGRWRDFAWARITARDTNYVSQVTCALHAKTLTGAHYYSSTLGTGGSWHGGAKVLAWTDPLNNGFYVGPVTVLDFQCRLGSNSNYQGVRGFALGE